MVTQVLGALTLAASLALAGLVSAGGSGTPVDCCGQKQVCCTQAGACCGTTAREGCCPWCDVCCPWCEDCCAQAGACCSAARPGCQAGATRGADARSCSEGPAKGHVSCRAGCSHHAK